MANKAEAVDMVMDVGKVWGLYQDWKRQTETNTRKDGLIKRLAKALEQQVLPIATQLDCGCSCCENRKLVNEAEAEI